MKNIVKSYLNSGVSRFQMRLALPAVAFHIARLLLVYPPAALCLAWRRHRRQHTRRRRHQARLAAAPRFTVTGLLIARQRPGRHSRQQSLVSLAGCHGWQGHESRVARVTGR